jgi:hypothetical protein
MKKKRELRMRVYVDIGSHGKVFKFVGGNIADRYPELLHVYHKKVTKDLKQATLIYKV